MSRFTLVQQFAIRSAIFVTVMALALGLVVTYAIREISLQAATRTAQITAEAMAHHQVKDADFARGTLSQSVRADLKEIVNRRSSDADIVAAKIWSGDGLLMFSSDSRDRLGSRFSDHDELQLALSGRLSREIAISRTAENANQYGRDGAVIEVYSPVVNDAGKPIGVFEIYQSYAPVAANLWRMTWLVWLVILIGAVPSYFLQLRFVQRAATRLDTAESALRQVNSRLESSLDDLEMHSLGTLQALVAAVDAKDSYTARHSMAVTDYAVATGRRLGLNEHDLKSLERVGLLHDVGKIGTPESILLKPAGLSDEEWQVVREHPEMGGHIVETIPFLAHLMPVVRSHHERWDGLGYPDRLKGDKIPLLARVLAVADAFDAMTSDRPYRKGMPTSSAAEEMVQGKGVQFDPDVVDALLSAVAAGELNVVIHDIPMRSRLWVRAAS